MKIFTLLFLSTLIIACHRGYDSTESSSLRDSVTKEHLSLLESDGSSDTIDINYKILKAYLENDTAFFRRLKTDIAQKKKTDQIYKNYDTCIHQKSLYSLNVDEAYRFKYASAFCDKILNVTVSRTEDSSSIHLILYQDNWLIEECKTISEYDKKITQKDWEKFLQLMDKADFWGLKGTNGRHGLDGSTLITTGYINKRKYHTAETKYNYVYRWGLTTLSEPFHYILKLSGNTQGCLVVK